MANEITVVLVGIGGYGHNYVSALLDAPKPQGFKIVGAVDPSPERCTRLADVQARGIPVFPSLEQFYASGRADLAVISTPIHLHCPHTCLALSHGSHVLCEKPLGATVEQAGEMIRARDRAGKVAAIGYQWSFAPTILALKADAMAGKLGRPRRLKTLVLAPRDEKYYGRSRWAGAKQDASGLWVLDSPVNNAAAHSVHNMFFVMGERVDRSAWPVRVTAELYRAHPIQNYDTAMLRAQADNGAEVFFAVSHAVQQARGPVFSYEFENGVVQYGEETNRRVVARFKDGTTKDYGSPDAERIRKLWATMDAIRGGPPVPCSLEAASAQTACMFGAQQSPSDIALFPASLVHVAGEPGSRKTWVDGLEQALTRCYDEWRLPSELGVAWAKPGREVDTRRYAELVL